MNADVLKARTKSFAVSAIKFINELPKSEENRVLGKQFLRSATSVAANYRAACRGRSTKEFYSKICIVVEEADETLFWLELFEESRLAGKSICEPLTRECSELVKIFASTKRTVGNQLNN